MGYRRRERVPSSRGADHGPETPRPPARGGERGGGWLPGAWRRRERGGRDGGSRRRGRPRREGSLRVRGVIVGSHRTPRGRASFLGRGPFKGGQARRLRLTELGKVCGAAKR